MNWMTSITNPLNSIWCTAVMKCESINNSHVSFSSDETPRLRLRSRRNHCVWNQLHKVSISSFEVTACEENHPVKIPRVRSSMHQCTQKQSGLTHDPPDCTPLAEMKMLSKSVSRAGENSVIWKFEHFGRKGYTIFFFHFLGISGHSPHLIVG